MTTKFAVADFETKAIDGNVCLNPPEPVGLAYMLPGEAPRYVTGMREMSAALKQLRKHPVVFHNANFDLSVWMHWFQAIGTPATVHDTMFLLFMQNPYSRSLSLKPAAEALLGEKPAEQDALKAWILSHVPGATLKNFGAYISEAPPALVAPYAMGDVTRTRDLFNLLKDYTGIPAYQTEIQLMPLLMESSRNGLRVDMDKLKKANWEYSEVMERVTADIYELFGHEFNIDSPAQLVAALESKGWMDGWEYTEKGNKSVAADALNAHCTNEQVGALLGYRGALETLLGTFMGPWAAQASATKGRLHTTWNQVRSYEAGNQTGTRTGRMSSSNPNFMNMPTDDKLVKVKIPKGYPELPRPRKFILPEAGHVWAGRDFDSQEVRILAHFEDGLLLEEYRKNPGLDPHQMASDMIKSATGLDVGRKQTKITAFAVIYGAGTKTLSKQLKCSVAEATQVKAAYLKTFPGVRDLQRDVTNVGRRGSNITTLRGRKYLTEPPVLAAGRYMTFEYKLLNYLIQGSAADQTKKCLVDWYSVKHEDVRYCAAVHDEINISIPRKLLKQELEKLREVMDQPMLDCPMKSTGYSGPTWGDVKK